jgi:hypothetical protein
VVVILALCGEVDAVDEVRETGAGDPLREVLDLVRRSLFVTGILLARGAWEVVGLLRSANRADESL